MKGLLVLLWLFQTGFLINVFKALSHRPAELRAFLNYHEVVMARRGKIPVLSLFIESRHVISYNSTFLQV